MLGKYIFRRIASMILIMVLVSVAAFIIIQLPPGDYLTTYLMKLEEAGQISHGMEMDEAKIASLRRQYGLDKPIYMQYLLWVWKMLHGDFGMSFEWQRPVLGLVMERLPFTIALSVAALIFTYSVAIPIGVYSATHQYSIGDFAATIVGFAGLAVPNFLLALILMWGLYSAFDLSLGGLFSQEYLLAEWS